MSVLLQVYVVCAIVLTMCKLCGSQVHSGTCCLYYTFLTLFYVYCYKCVRCVVLVWLCASSASTHFIMGHMTCHITLLYSCCYGCVLLVWLCAGSVPAQFIIESIMEHVAKSLNKDPTDVRTVNLFKQGQVRQHNEFLVTQIHQTREYFFFLVTQMAGQTQNPVTYRDASTLFHSLYNGDWKKENGGYPAHLDPIWRLEQAQHSTMFRLRTGHCGLSAHLKRIGISDTSLCECGQADQTPDHVLQSCPVYTEKHQLT